MKKQLRDLESKDLWIQARVDELMDDDDWIKGTSESLGFIEPDEWYLRHAAEQQAQLNYAEIEAMTLNAQIDNLELK